MKSFEKLFKLVLTCCLLIIGNIFCFLFHTFLDFGEEVLSIFLITTVICSVFIIVISSLNIRKKYVYLLIGNTTVTVTFLLFLASFFFFLWIRSITLYKFPENFEKQTTFLIGNELLPGVAEKIPSEMQNDPEFLLSHFGKPQYIWTKASINLHKYYLIGSFILLVLSALFWANLLVYKFFLHGWQWKIIKPSKGEEPLILFLAANPPNTDPLDLEDEIRSIEEQLDSTSTRVKFSFKLKLGVRTVDFQKALMDEMPYLVHFSGHGMSSDSKVEGIILRGRNGNPTMLNGKALADTFKLSRKTIQCVVLNACYSKTQAEYIVKHIPFVIGMPVAIGDETAIDFSSSFYAALTRGMKIPDAFNWAKTNCYKGNDSTTIPVLLCKSPNN